MKKFYLIFNISLLLFSLSSCKEKLNVGDYITNTTETALTKIISKDKQNCIVYYSNKENNDYYSSLYLYANDYYYNNSNTNFYTIDVANLSKENIFYTQVHEFDNNITSLSNLTVLYNNGNIYRIGHENLLDEQRSGKKAYYKSFIDGSNSFANKIDYVVDENINSLIKISAEEINIKIDNKESFLVMFGKDNCGGCQTCIPKLNSFIKKNHYKIYYTYDINDVNNLKIEWTPTIITYDKGILKNYYVGCIDSTSLANIFNK